MNCCGVPEFGALERPSASDKWNQRGSRVFRTQDRIAAEVVQAQARPPLPSDRTAEACGARETLDQSLEGMKQTTRVGEKNLLLRPAGSSRLCRLGRAYDFYA